jgi:hypothetical protein
VLRTQNITAQVIPLADAERAEERMPGPQGLVVFISALPPSAVTGARQAYRRLRRQSAGIRTLIGVWDRKASPADLERQLGLPESGDVVTTLDDAINALTARSAVTKADTQVLENPTKAGGWQGPRIEEWFDRLLRELAQAFNVPLSLVSLVDRDSTFWRNHAATLPGLAKASEAANDESLCRVALEAENDLLVVEDVAKDRRLSTNTVLTEGGVRFYAGAVLRLEGGHPVGVLCVSDTKERTAPAEALDRLRKGATELIALIEARAASEKE